MRLRGPLERLIRICYTGGRLSKLRDLPYVSAVSWWNLPAFVKRGSADGTRLREVVESARWIRQTVQKYCKCSDGDLFTRVRRLYDTDPPTETMCLELR